MLELGVLALLLAVAAAFVLPPLRRAAAADSETDEAEAAAIRYRMALEALRDVEVDRNIGSLDEDAYARERDAAEERAVLAHVERDAAISRTATSPSSASPGTRRAALLLAAVAGAAVLVGSLLPPPLGLANTTAVNEALAAAQAAEDERQERIALLLERLASDQLDVPTLSALADAYLAGESRDDLAAAVRVLQVVISLEPENLGAYRRTITAYLRAGDYDNAAAALNAYAEVETDAAEVAFFRGIIALRGHEDPAAAIEAFDDFLRLAPDDPRAPMVRSLRAEAQEAD